MSKYLGCDMGSEMEEIGGLLNCQPALPVLEMRINPYTIHYGAYEQTISW
ncbi:hypothetical protein NC653_017044 [Populus alba x Populus x berolinensis]|uniref:Uncharacterized protein n=1 Tax=Populus alba x Populus x berolinensis TaxID=444605 RepID=A0AAD6QPI5_9ROSI|nr:hypothetical protein NC653_017044 [Populus alba x Populus x berolinensis]